MYDSKQTGEYFDHREGNPYVDQFVKLIKDRNWKELRTLYQSLSPSMRHHTIFCSAYFLSPEERLGCEEREEVELLVIMGGLKTCWAFKARGFGRGEEIPEEDWIKAIDTAYEAENYLEKALSLNELDSAIYGFYILANMLTEPSEDENGDVSVDYAVTNRCVNLMKASNDTINIFAAHAMILFDAPKWHGSLEQINKTVEHLSDIIPKAAWCGLKAYAKYETWLWYVVFEEDETIRKKFINTLDTPMYIAELKNLNDQFWAEVKNSKTQSIHHIYAHNQFANLFCRLAFYELARKHLKAMGKNVFFNPWSIVAEKGAYKDINAYRIKSFLLPLNFKSK